MCHRELLIAGLCDPV